jgi:parallel beta-helix repeat protein
VLNNSPSGIFFELSEGPGWIDNNIVAYNRGQGIYTHDAHGVVVAHNLVFSNQTFGVYMHIATSRSTSAYRYLTGRERIQGGASWNRVYNNIIVDNPSGALSFPHPSPRVQDNRSDYNLYNGESNVDLRFVVNANNGLPGGATAISDAAREAFERTGDPGLSQHDMSVWEGRGVIMNLPQWRAATGNDRNSIVGDVRAVLDQESYELVIETDGSPQDLDCPPVPAYDIRDFNRYQLEVDRDYAGRPLRRNRLLPGAFQQLKPGRTRTKVWPVTFDRPEMPPRVHLEPAADARDMGPIEEP